MKLKCAVCNHRTRRPLTDESPCIDIGLPSVTGDVSLLADEAFIIGRDFPKLKGFLELVEGISSVLKVKVLLAFKVKLSSLFMSKGSLSTFVWVSSHNVLLRCPLETQAHTCHWRVYNRVARGPMTFPWICRLHVDILQTRSHCPLYGRGREDAGAVLG